MSKVGGWHANAIMVLGATAVDNEPRLGLLLSGSAQSRYLLGGQQEDYRLLTQAGNGLLATRSVSRRSRYTVIRHSFAPRSAFHPIYTPLDLILSIKAPKEVSIHAPLNMKRMKEMFNSDCTPSAKHLTSFISCLPALRHLSLSFQVVSAMLVFGVIEWPRLTSLALTRFRINEQDFVGFLHRHSALQDVALQDVVLIKSERSFLAG